MLSTTATLLKIVEPFRNLALRIPVPLAQHTLYLNDWMNSPKAATVGSAKTVGLAPNGTRFVINVAGTLRVPSANSCILKGCGTWKVPATF